MRTAHRIIGQVAASVAHIQDPQARLAEQVGQLQGELRKLIDTYEGVRDPLYDYLETTIGDSPVLVEFEYEAGEDAVYDLNSPMCGPGCPASVGIGMALINGTWTSTEGFPPEWLAKWEQAAIDQKTDQQREDYESRMSERDYE